ncbi:MAG: hypothetical protein RIU67_492 [Actinomycetota bacterium]
MRRHDEKSRGFERIGATHRIEGILNVVATRGHQNSGVAENVDGRDPAGHRRVMVPTLQEQIRLGQRNDRDSGLGHTRGHFALHVDGLHRQAHAVTGRHRSREAAVDHGPGQIAQSQHVGIESFVDVQVDPDSGIGGGGQGHVDHPRTVGLEMRTTAHEIDPELERRRQGSAVAGSFRSAEGRMHERDDLNVDQVGHGSPRRVNRSKMHEVGIGLPHIHVGAHNGDSRRHQLGERRFRALCHLLETEHSTLGRADPGVDGAHEVALRIRDLVRGQRLVEMRVRFGQSGKHDPPATIEHVRARRSVDRQIGTDGLDAPRGDEHVDGSTAGVDHVADQMLGHGHILTRTPRRLDAAWKTAMVKFGVWIYPVAPAEQIVDAIRSLEHAGVDEVWIADEGVAREPLSLFAAASMVTSTIRFGVGITSPLLRHPGAVASAAMTVDELSGGRLTLGWGVGGHESLGPFGLATDRPVGAVRDALRIAGAVMRGRATEDYSPPAHAAPERSIPQFVGARGEQLNRLASREADGVFLSGFEHHDLSRVITLAHSHRPISIALYQSVRFTSDEDRWSIAGSPDRLANRLASLASEFTPDSLGLALVDGGDLEPMIDGAIETIGRLRLHFAHGS